VFSASTGLLTIGELKLCISAGTRLVINVGFWFYAFVLVLVQGSSLWWVEALYQCWYSWFADCCGFFEVTSTTNFADCCESLMLLV
jgi:hypothetical protein